MQKKEEPFTAVQIRMLDGNKNYFHADECGATISIGKNTPCSYFACW